MSRTPTQPKRPSILATSVVALLGFGLLLDAPRAAADEYWDGTSYPTNGSGVANGMGGDGTWAATAAANWVNSAGGNPMFYDPTQLAIFSTIGGTVGVQDNLNFSGMRFDADGYLFLSSGGTLSPTGTAPITANGANINVYIATQLTGTGGINFGGAGAVYVVGNNTYSGGTTLGAGATLYADGLSTTDAPLGTGTLTISGAGATIGTNVEGTTLANPITVTTPSFSVTNKFSPLLNQLASLGGTRPTDLTFNGTIDLTGSTRTIIGGTTSEQVHFGTGGIGVVGETAGVNYNTTFTGRGQYVAFIFDNGNVNNYTGTTTVNNGAFLVLQSFTAGGSFKGDIDIEGNGVVDYDLSAEPGVIPSGASNQINNPNAVVTVKSNGNSAVGTSFAGFDLYQSTGDTIGTLQGFGTVGLAGATLTLNGGNFSGSIGDGRTGFATGGGINKVSSSTLVLSGTNTYYGATTIAAGTIQAGATNTFAPLSGVTVNSGATLDLSSFNQTIGSLNDGGGGGGTVNLGSATLTAGGNNGTTSFSGVIQGTGGFTKVGAGTQTLTGMNSYSGATTVNGGALSIDASTNPTGVLSGNSALAMGGGTLAVTSSSATSATQTLNGLSVNAGANSITVGNSAAPATTTLDLRGSAGTAGITRTTGAVVDFNAGAGSTFGTNVFVMTHQANDATGILGAWATVNNGAAFAANDGGDNIVAYTGYAGINSGGDTVLDIANNNVEISNANGGGTDTVANPGGTTTINTLTQNTGDSTTIDTVSGTLRVGAVGGIFITPLGGNLTIGVAGTAGTLTAGGSDNTPGELILENNSPNTLTINSVIADNGSGSVTVTVAGSGVTALESANSYTGATTIDGGTLRTDAAGALPTNTALTVNAGGTLDLNSNSQTVASLSDGTNGGGTVVLNNASLTIGGSANSTFSGLLQDGSAPGAVGSLVMNGTGTLTISGTSNTYSGGTMLNSGTLIVNGSAIDGSGSPLGSGTLTIANGTTLATTIEPTTGASGTTLAVPIVVNGDFSIATNRDAANPGAQSFTLNGPLDLGGATRTITGLTPGGQIHLGGVISDGGINFSTSAAVQADGSTPYTAFILQGTASNTYGNATSVNAGAVVIANVSGGVAIPGDLTILGNGVVRLAQSSQLAATSNVIDNSTGNTIQGVFNAGLDLANNSQGIATLQGSGTIALGSGTLTITGSTTSTFTGVISDGSFGTGGNVVLNGVGGTLLLTGANTYTGATQVINGTLQTGAANVIPSTSIVTVDTGGTLDLLGSPQTIAALSDGSTGGGQVHLEGATLTVGSDLTDLTFSYSGGIDGTVTGGVTKIGTVTQIFAGNNTYTGPTLINGGTLELTGSNVSPVTIGPGSTLGVGSSGSINTGAGQTAVTMTQGTTFVNAGNVIGTGAGSIGVAMTGSSNTLDNLAGATISAETAIVVTNPTGANTIDNGGTITGTGGIAIDARLSAGVSITNTGIINGKILLGNGNNTVELVTGTPLPPAITGGTGTDTLILAGGGESTLNLNTVTGFEILDKIGGGLWNLTGAGSFPLGTSIQDGTLNVLGNLTSNVFVASAGTLTGIGVINGNVINQGNVIPGIPSSVLTPMIATGKLTIAGNYTQYARGTLTIQVNGGKNGQYSQLSIGGHAQLGGTLVLQNSGTRLNFGQRISILTAAGGVSGTFSKIDNPLADSILAFGGVIYEPNAVLLEGPSFLALDSQFHLTYNQRAVATALDSAAIDPRAAKLLTYLDNRPLKNLPSDFDHIAPEEMASVFRIGVSLSDVQARNLQRRTADLRAGASGFSASGFQTTGGPNYSGGVAGANGSAGADGKTASAPSDPRWGSFITGVGDFAHVGDSGNANGYDLNTGGITVGADYRLNDHLAVGVTAGYTGTNANLTENGRLLVNGGKVGAYGTYFTGGFHTDAALTNGYSNYSTRRSALQGDAFGNTQGTEFEALADAGYDWKLDALTIGPTASFQYTYVGIDGFTERGSLAPLRYPDQHQSSIRSSFGLRMAYDWKVGGVIIRPEGEFSWQHEYGDRSYSIDSAFASGAGSAFSVADTPLGRDSLLFGGGVSVLWNPRTSTYLFYDADLLKKDYYSQSVTGGLRMNF